MARYVAVALTLAGIALGLRGFYVWTGCGYDCPVLSSPSLTATGAILFGIMVAAGGIVVLVASILGRKSDPGQ